MQKQVFVRAALIFFMVIAVVSVFLGGYFLGINVGSSTQSTLRGRDSENPHTEKLTQHGSWHQQSCFPRRRTCPSDLPDPPLLLISLDGFRPDYLDKTVTLKRLAQCGVHSKYMRPIFPTKTFPNHYSIVTGLFPESHGIIDNSMYNPKTKKKFSLRNRQDNYNPEWWEAEPLWVTAEKQGKKTATYFWPGSEVKIKGKRPTYYYRYNSKVSWSTRLETVMSWLDLPPEDRPSFITFYVNEPDHTAHVYGPHASQVSRAIARVDNLIDQLMSGLQKRQLLNCIDIIVVSDHGMDDMTCDKVVLLGNYVNSSTVHFMPGPIGRIRPVNESDDAVENLIKKFRCTRPEILVYEKKELPKRYHYSANKKIEPVIIDLPGEWTIAKSLDKQKCSGGNHGYDNLNQNMNAFFLAYGPSFQRNLIIEPFLNLELYELMTELLDIKPEPNNGTRGSLHHILKSPQLLQSTVAQKPITTCVISSQQSRSRKLSGCNCRAENVSADQIYFPADVGQNYESLLPWGTPTLKDSDSFSVCHLLNSDYVTAFHKGLRLPLWTSFTLTKKNSVFSGMSKFISNKCWLADGRVPIENLSNCTDYNALVNEYPGLQQRQLFPILFANSETSELSVQLMTNAVPMYQNFQMEIWSQFIVLLSKWTQKHGSLNVVIGPAFDIFGNGLKPSVNELIKHSNGKLSVPTHYFAVITHCHASNIPLNSCRSADLDVLAFLIPHRTYPENCQNISEYFLKHSANVKDVEWLTGLEFFTSLPTYTAIQLRTHLIDHLWDV